MRANQKYKDVYGIERKAGEEWLVTFEKATYHILDVSEELVKTVPLTVLNRK